MVKLLPSFIYNSGNKGKGHQGFDSLSPLQLSDYLVSHRVQWNLQVLTDLQAFLLFIRRNQTCENIPALIPSGRAVIFHWIPSVHRHGPKSFLLSPSSKTWLRLGKQPGCHPGSMDPGDAASKLAKKSSWGIKLLSSSSWLTLHMCELPKVLQALPLEETCSLRLQFKQHVKKSLQWDGV